LHQAIDNFVDRAISPDPDDGGEAFVGGFRCQLGGVSWILGCRPFTASVAVDGGLEDVG
jgi:hypothetical protein